MEIIWNLIHMTSFKNGTVFRESNKYPCMYILLCPFYLIISLYRLNALGESNLEEVNYQSVVWEVFYEPYMNYKLWTVSLTQTFQFKYSKNFIFVQVQ